MMVIIENRDAQFMLLAGFIIAIGLVITTVILNSIMFEGNMAIGAGADVSKNDIINLMQIAKDEARAAYRNSINASGPKNKTISNFTYQTGKFRENLSTIQALYGTGANLSWDASSWNNSLYPEFTDNGTAGGATNWTVMESVKAIYVFELRNVSGSEFEVNISNQATGEYLWSMKLNGTDYITIKNAGGTVGTYGVNYTYIDLLNPSYQFKNNVGSNISKISFLNGQDASGRFKITGNTSYNRNFTRAVDYFLNATVTFSTGRVRINITLPVSVPW